MGNFFLREQLPGINAEGLAELEKKKNQYFGPLIKECIQPINSNCN
jgi:hypothetical protein